MRPGLVLLVAGPIVFAAFGLLWWGTSEHPDAGGGDRAVAVGMLLDSPRPLNEIDKALWIADRLVERYGIDSGDHVRDREEAARRARAEVLDPLRFTEEEIGGMASSLGYSLDPEVCRNTCENVRNLAVLELEKAALEAAVGNRGRS
jgi:hypothetical protein